MNNIEKIKKIIEENNGILLTRELKENNIHLQYLKQLENTGYIRKVDRGVYLTKNKEVNEFFFIRRKI